MQYKALREVIDVIVFFLEDRRIEVSGVIRLNFVALKLKLLEPVGFFVCFSIFQ